MLGSNIHKCHLRMLFNKELTYYIVFFINEKNYITHVNITKMLFQTRKIIWTIGSFAKQSSTYNIGNDVLHMTFTL